MTRSRAMFNHHRRSPGVRAAEYLGGFMTHADVRVLMPCFDDDPMHIHEAVESVREQSFTAWKLVIVDDGSRDPRTLDALEALRHTGDDRITVVHQPNCGPSAARNRAAQGAETEFLLCLDGDDRISANFLDVAVARLRERDDVCAVYPTTQKFGALDERVVDDEFDWNTQLVRNLIPVTALVRRSDFERVGGFDERMRHGLEDHDFFLHLLRTTRRPALKAPEATLFYRIRSGSRNTTSHGDLATMYAARGMLMAKHGELYVEHPELVYAAELRFRDECLRWRARYGRVERVKSLLKLDRFAPHIG